MKTKIVYSVVSSLSDYYYEQLWVSAFSLKYYNPDAKIYVIVDKTTYDGIINSYRKESVALFESLIPVAVDQKFSNLQKSRWLKTNLRNLIDGDYLFIDSDTIITEDLSTIDNLDCNIGMVLDYHDVFQNNWNYKREIEAAKRIYNIDCSNVIDYFNSGVIFCKDNKITREFYTLWHKNWEISIEHGRSFDQLPLMITGLKLPSVCKEINGIYNCQITVDLNYLADAKIMHFFSSTDTSFTPFKDKSTYSKIKEEGGINEDLKDLILNCKRRFNRPVYIMDSKAHAHQETPLFQIYMSLFTRKDIVFKILNKIADCILKLKNKTK